MSIPVPLDRLAQTLATFGHAYLLTASAEGAIKVNTVDPVVTDAGLVIASRAQQARLNIDAHPAVTVVWPPTTRHGHTLIVDGTATYDEATITVAVGHAVLHRPADHADGPAWAPTEACTEDCRPV